MNKMLLPVLVLVCGVGCGASTIIGSADADVCGVSYPKSGFYGANVLYPNVTTVAAQPTLNTIAYPMEELVASHPVGATVKVNMTLLAGSVWYIGGNANDWRATLYDPTTGKQTFETPDVAGVSESSIFFVASGQALVQLFECGSTTPTSSKTISWSAGDGGVLGLDGGIVGLDGGGIVGRDGGGIVGLDGGGIVGRDGGGIVGLDGSARF